LLEPGIEYSGQEKQPCILLLFRPPFSPFPPPFFFFFRLYAHVLGPDRFSVIDNNIARFFSFIRLGFCIWFSSQSTPPSSLVKGLSPLSLTRTSRRRRCFRRFDGLTPHPRSDRFRARGCAWPQVFSRFIPLTLFSLALRDSFL